ncbi:hypothetical protein [Streptomyces sp. WMMC897]|uniref:hypothetical protein n=1 Tax=Streptomyces sp. WMMC897 TaxID=3014782 RepID=UPI0022B71CDE|nr:hypothetical protein [Streptomyces sp. WMMC897]MCZ7414117.1 hypothetical protein [Streptomyces sp. WMMC897]
MTCGHDGRSNDRTDDRTDDWARGVADLGEGTDEDEARELAEEIHRSAALTSVSAHEDGVAAREAEREE